MEPAAFEQYLDEFHADWTAEQRAGVNCCTGYVPAEPVERDHLVHNAETRSYEEFTHFINKIAAEAEQLCMNNPELAERLAHHEGWRTHAMKRWAMDEIYSAAKRADEQHKAHLRIT